MLAISVMIALRWAEKPSDLARQACGEVAVDVDQRFQLRRIRIELHVDGLFHHEHTDIGNVLTNLQRLRIVVGFHCAHEDRPQPAVEQQRVVHILVGTGPVGLNVLQLSCRFQEGLRLDFPRRCRRLRRAGVGLSGMRHPSPLAGLYAGNAGIESCSTFVRGCLSNMVRNRFRICLKPGKSSRHLPTAPDRTFVREDGELPPAVSFSVLDRFWDQRNSCSTLCCDWLASASAETAIDWRVDSAWLLAASSLESARVRLADPVCSTLMM